MIDSRSLRSFVLVAGIVPASVLAGAFVRTDNVMAQFAGSANATPWSGRPGASEESDHPTPIKRAVQIVLREGTYVGPVRGRFVVHGQRWSFLAESQASPTEQGKTEWLEGGLAREILTEQDTLLARQRSTTDSETLQGLNARGPQSHRGGVTAPTFDSMIVIENLMLDRIVRAIKEDPEDDYWTITATVTEFQDENRLVLLTVTRARKNRGSVN
ncbi:hypothetical protein [Aporhodopirellula aestuarii]|uniref:Uncharacterized protein n=1 Tax=Aporhodopirellula aestuarii TaxID=2950107 RepID=A0ABT0UAA0_9BACT|nr:hypothetical protein [Aporhodopirellula aestuarii]MCM2373882.1 hypothetical protein [Aporhodopirellula aestuarii]